MACAHLVVFTGYGFPGVLIAAVGFSLLYLLSYEIWLIRAKCRSQRRRCRCSYIIGSVVCVFCFSLVRTIHFFISPFELLELPGDLNNRRSLLLSVAGTFGTSTLLLYVFACKEILRNAEKQPDSTVSADPGNVIDTPIKIELLNGLFVFDCGQIFLIVYTFVANYTGLVHVLLRLFIGNGTNITSAALYATILICAMFPVLVMCYVRRMHLHIQQLLRDAEPNPLMASLSGLDRAFCRYLYPSTAALLFYFGVGILYPCVEIISPWLDAGMSCLIWLAESIFVLLLLFTLEGHRRPWFPCRACEDEQQVDAQP